MAGGVPLVVSWGGFLGLWLLLLSFLPVVSGEAWNEIILKWHGWLLLEHQRRPHRQPHSAAVIIWWWRAVGLNEHHLIRLCQIYGGWHLSCKPHGAKVLCKWAGSSGRNAKTTFISFRHSSSLIRHWIKHGEDDGSCGGIGLRRPSLFLSSHCGITAVVAYGWKLAGNYDARVRWSMKGGGGSQWLPEMLSKMCNDLRGILHANMVSQRYASSLIGLIQGHTPQYTQPPPPLHWHFP